MADSQIERIIDQLDNYLEDNEEAHNDFLKLREYIRRLEKQCQTNK